MTDTERLILQGIAILMRTQSMPNNIVSRDDYFAKLIQDMKQWATDYNAKCGHR